MMADKNIEDFFEEVRASADLQSILEELQESCGNDLLKMYVALAGKRGYEFSEAQLRAALEEKAGEMTPEGPLDDEQMESVSAAGCPWCMFTRGSYCFFTK